MRRPMTYWQPKTLRRFAIVERGLGLDAQQNFTSIRKSLPPTANSLTIDTHLSRLHDTQLTSGRPQDNLGTLDQSLFFGARTRQIFDYASLSLRQNYFCCRLRHHDLVQEIAAF